MTMQTGKGIEPSELVVSSVDNDSGDLLMDDCAEATEAAQVAEEPAEPTLEAKDVGAVGGLNEEEQKRLRSALIAIWSIPFVGDIRDFTWEAAFAYVKGLPIPDPLKEGTSKRLFDIVDHENRKGWSQKALQKNSRTIEVGNKIEFVIQRADIFNNKNAKILGYPDGLDRNTPEATLGEALVKYWQDKFKRDAKDQGVDENQAFVGVLLKNKNRTEYIYFEHPVPLFNELLNPELYKWEWTNNDKKGLQAKRKSDSAVALRWYPAQTQMFECVTIPQDAVRLSIASPARMTEAEFALFIADRVKQQEIEPIS